MNKTDGWQSWILFRTSVLEWCMSFLEQEVLFIRIPIAYYHGGDHTLSLNLWGILRIFLSSCLCVICNLSLNHFLLDGNWLLWAVLAFTPVTRESFMCLLHYLCSTGTCFPFFPQLIVLESCMEVTFLMDFGIVSMSQLYFLWIWSELYFLWISQHANKSKQCKQREVPITDQADEKTDFSWSFSKISLIFE